jgi:hypothetical protein
MFSSCRFSPPCSPRWHAPAGVRPGSHPAKPSAIAPPHPLRCLHTALGLRPPPALPSRFASFISELASHEVPGLGAPALPSALGLEALASASAIARGHGVSASGQRWQTCLRRHGNLLASQVPRRGRLYPYKGTQGARIVSARRGELMRSFRGAQVRGPVRLWVRLSGSAPADAYTVPLDLGQEGQSARALFRLDDPDPGLRIPKVGAWVTGPLPRSRRESRRALGP